MLEVGNLANATEDRSHFSAWALASSPLILSFNLSDPARMDRAWPIISNRAVLAVNQRWVGDPGRRVVLDDTGGWQAWAKHLGAASYAVLLLSTGAAPARASLPLRNVSAALAPHGACLRDLYSGEELSPLPPGAPLEAELPVHDSALYCAWPSSAQGACDGSAPNDCP